MSIEPMTRIDKNAINANTGAVYHETVSIDTGTYSDIYLIPTQQIYAISALINGDGVVEFSNDSQETLETGSPDWIEWDGVSEINFGVTAFRVKWISGTVVFKITVKTADM